MNFVFVDSSLPNVRQVHGNDTLRQAQCDNRRFFVSPGRHPSTGSGWQ